MEPRRNRFDGRRTSKEVYAWLESKEGWAVCRNSVSGEYLRNRLLIALEAGMEIALKLEDERNSKVVQ
jgi:hypothetical protein